MRMAVLLVASIVLPGCYSLSQYPTAEKVAAATVVEHDEYERLTRVKSPEVWYAMPSRAHTARLETVVPATGSPATRLHIYYEGVVLDGGPALLDSAVDRDGNHLETTVIERNVDYVGASVPGFGYGVTYQTTYDRMTERVAVGLPDGYLERVAEAGLDMQLSGETGRRTVVKLPPHYVQGFLAKLETVLPKETDEPILESPVAVASPER